MTWNITENSFWKFALIVGQGERQKEVVSKKNVIPSF